MYLAKFHQGTDGRKTTTTTTTTTTIAISQPTFCSAFLLHEKCIAYVLHRRGKMERGNYKSSSLFRSATASRPKTRKSFSISQRSNVQVSKKGRKERRGKRGSTDFCRIHFPPVAKQRQLARAKQYFSPQKPKKMTAHFFRTLLVLVMLMASLVLVRRL